MIADLQLRVAALKPEAMEELREDLRTLGQMLDQLAERAARELKDLKAEVDFVLIDAEVGLRLTVDDAKAHLKVIEAKRELILARMAILRNDLIEAEARIESALRDLEEAQSLAVGHHENIAALQNQAQEMLAAVRAKAGALRVAIDALIERSNRLLKEMSGGQDDGKNRRMSYDFKDSLSLSLATRDCVAISDVDLQNKIYPFGKRGIKGDSEMLNRRWLRKSPLTPLLQRGE